ncbi:MAG: hypothetical protein ACLP01_16470 [Solirubrobacteraceae bacterium]
MHGFTAAGAPVRFVLTRADAEATAEPSGEGLRFGSVLVDAGALSAVQLRDAAVLLGHLNEAWFGYRSGDPSRPCAGEPRAGFEPEQTTLGDRLQAKASELGYSVWKLSNKRRELVRRVAGRARRRACDAACGRPGG